MLGVPMTQPPRANAVLSCPACTRQTLLFSTETEQALGSPLASQDALLPARQLEETTW